MTTLIRSLGFVRHVAMAVAGYVLMSAAHAQLEEFSMLEAHAMDGLREEWRNGRELLSTVDPGCMSGLHVESRGLQIISVQPPAAASEIQAGDTLVAVNGTPMADGSAFDAFVKPLAENEALAISVTRNGTAVNVSFNCGARSAWGKQFAAALQAALDAKYDECLTKVRALDELAGRKVGHAKLAYECLQAQRVQQGIRPTREIAAFYFDIYHRLAAPAVYSPSYRDSVRDTVTRAAALLRRYKRDSFANRLEKLLEDNRAESF